MISCKQSECTSLVSKHTPGAILVFVAFLQVSSRDVKTLSWSGTILEASYHGPLVNSDRTLDILRKVSGSPNMTNPGPILTSGPYFFCISFNPWLIRPVLANFVSGRLVIEFRNGPGM